MDSFCDLKELTTTTSIGTRMMRLAAQAAKLAKKYKASFSLLYLLIPHCLQDEIRYGQNKTNRMLDNVVPIA